MPALSVNIDHVATVREARYRRQAPELGEPDPLRAMHEAEMGGADGITVHLREDRRHIQDRDAELLRSHCRVKFNFEMAATTEMFSIAERLQPHTAMLVPEGRDEVTTEGGLDVDGQRAHLRDHIARLRSSGVLVSVFIDADARQIEAAAALGVDVCEIHTGPYAHRFFESGGDFRTVALMEALRRVRDAATFIVDAGMRANAGHALNYANVGPIAAIIAAANTGPGWRRAAVTREQVATNTVDRGELHIGHAIVSRAIFVGLKDAVAEMKGRIAQAVLRVGSFTGPVSDQFEADLIPEASPRPEPPTRGTRLA